MTVLRSLLLALALLVSGPALAQTGDSDWLYRGSDIARDPAWRFGTLPNGVRYAVRRNARPPGQVSVRVRIEAGALNEQDNEQGWAHFVEHMAFRGTASFADREARHIWQELGASFGSDTNASTSNNQTVYQLDLPRNDRASIDRSLHVLSEMMTSARFDPAIVETERGVVLAEKERRPELGTRIGDITRPLFYSGLRQADRNIIGTVETLRGANAEGLRAFYRRWYRPERATVIMVGDADPETMEALIAARFGGWRGEGPAPAEPDYGRLAAVRERVASLAYPGAPYSGMVMWLRPYDAAPHTLAREQELLEEELAERIVNRRLEAHARGDSAFISAAVGTGSTRNVADSTRLSVTARGERWQEALQQSFAILRDALRAPPSAAEIDREIQVIRTNAQAAVTGEATVLSQLRAQQLINAIESRSVVSTAPATLATFERMAPLMTPERVAAAMQRLFAGEGPRMMLVSPAAVPGGNAAVASALGAAERAAPAARRADRQVSFDSLPRLGPPGRELSRQRIEDLDVTIVRFENGSTLTFKRTEYERGTVQVQLRFGEGLAGLAPDRPSLHWLSGIVGPSGIGDLDLDSLERMMVGRRMAMNFALAEDAIVLRGQTNAADLPDQLRLLTTKIAHPRWDPQLFGRFQANALESYELAFASASSRAGRELGGVVRPGDRRWSPVERDEIAGATVEQMRAFFTPLLAAGPVHAVIVGDVTLDQAVEAVRSTVAALPRRPETQLRAASRAVRPPAPNPQPRRFTHQGDPSQAFATIGWSTFGGEERLQERRALGLAANIFRVRLYDRLREVEGASYSPSASASSSTIFPEWGIFYAAAEVRPQNVETFFRIAREIVAELAARPVAADEFARAQNPAVSGIERRLTTNGYWLGAIEDFVRRPASVEEVRSYLPGYRAMTAEDVRRAVAAHVAEQGDWSMVVLPARTAASGQ